MLQNGIVSTGGATDTDCIEESIVNCAGSSVTIERRMLGCEDASVAASRDGSVPRTPGMWHRDGVSSLGIAEVSSPTT